jgi:asparagine synthase (glutamine-hydrolysing)
MKQMVHLNQKWFMQTLLDRKDRMSMYSGLEVRVPFCDHRIAEYMYSVPWEYKDYNGKEKGLLRYAMQGILPHDVLYRKKSPYPKTHDPQYMSLVSGMLQELLKQKDAPIFSMIKREKLQLLAQQEFSEPWYGQLMGLPQTIAFMLQINMWLEMYCVDII